MRSIKKNSVVFVKHILGETAEKLVTRLEDGTYRFNCDAYVSGEPCRGGFFHLRQARQVIPGKKLGNNLRSWPRLRKALHLAGVKPINIPGGDCPIHYNDEIVVPDFSMSGAHYFVLKRSDIGKYLDLLPLDEAGRAKAEEISKREGEVAAEAYRQAHDPLCIAERFGKKLYHCGAYVLGGEFHKVTLVAEDSSEFSVIFPTYSTNLIWSGSNVPKVVCEAPETGITYLSGWTAGRLEPWKHKRIKKVYNEGWRCYTAYLMPDPKLATEVRENSSWLRMFDSADLATAKRIASAKRIILEGYDLYDVIIKERFVFDNGEVTKERLLNWPYDMFNEKNGEFEWGFEE